MRTSAESSLDGLLPVPEDLELGQVDVGGDPDRVQAIIPLVADVAHAIGD